MVAQKLFPFADACKGVADIACPEIPINQVGSWQDVTHGMIRMHPDILEASLWPSQVVDLPFGSTHLFQCVLQAGKVIATTSYHKTASCRREGGISEHAAGCEGCVR